ncbi:MAG: class I tRNA ligase family protein, partial [Verrucomicrobiae bacterium]|nr:class I tRNA ligase family protein [Verrucomicrobiae bacterium]
MQLHPYMPHLSEELWEKMGFGGADGPAFLMRTPLDDSLILHGIPVEKIEAARQRVTAIYEAVGRARNLKAEYGLAANRSVRFIVDPEGIESGALDASAAAVFARLAGAGEVRVETGHAAETGVPVALTGVGKLYMPLEGLIDVAAERDRLSKELAKAEAELAKVNAKLNNESFVSRAPDEVVQENRDRQAQWKSRVEELGRMIESLGALQ